MYTLTENNESIIRNSDNTFIPVDPRNTDYQEYIAWLAEGNTPNPANELVSAPVSEILAWQGMLWIVRNGHEEAINAAVAKLTGENRILAKMMMSTADAVWKIDNEMVQMMLGEVIGLNAEQRQDAFSEASAYTYPGQPS